MAITTLQELQKATEARQQLLQGQDTGTAPTTNTGGEVFYRDTSVGTQPVEAYNPYTTEAPQSVIDAQNQYNQVNIATQEYADKMTARIIADRNGYITDNNYQGMMNKTLTDQAYNYLKRANNGADDSAWGKSNPEDDLFTKYLPEILNLEETRKQSVKKLDTDLSKDERIVKNVYNRSNTAQRAIIDAGNMEHGSWYLMSPLEKAKYLIVPGSNATMMDNIPEWTKWITNIAPAFMAGGGGAMLGSLIPIPGAGTVAGLVVGGLTYLQGVTGIQIPIINDVLSAIDLGEKVEPYFTGGISAISKAYHEKFGDTPLTEAMKSGDLDIIDLAATAGEIMKDPANKYLWEVSKFGYEVGADAMDDILRTIRNAGAAVSDKVFGTEFGKREAGQVSRANIGRSGIEDLVEGTYGSQSLIDVYLPLYTNMVEEAMRTGMTEKQAVDFANQNFQQYILNYTGTTGLVTDLAAQSVVDPANLAPFIQAKTAQGIGKITRDKALENAGKAAAGNPLIDLLPPGIQQGAEGILSVFHKNTKAPELLKTYGSQGMDIIKSTIKEAYRGEYDVNKLSGWQRYVAGIDKDGHIKEFMPNKESGNAVKDFFTNMMKTTNDTKMFDVSQMTADFLGSALFNDDVPLSYVPDLVEQAVGRKPITPDSPLARFKDTAMLKTLQDQFAGVSDTTIDMIKEDVQNYRKYAENRAVINDVAKQLNMTPQEVLDALDNKKINDKDPRYKGMSDEGKKMALDSERQKLYKEIRDKDVKVTTQDNTVLDPEQVIQKIEVFKTNTDTTYDKNWVGRKQYNESYLKADIMTRLADMADEFNLIRYNIEPDAWAIRTSNLMKNIQSIALLNFSTSYQVNNFLNNIITRHVAGVGGFDTKFINDVNKARGLSYSRAEGSTYEKTGKRIKEAKKPNDKLQKVSDMFDNVKEAKIMKGVTNLPIEQWETNAAANIGFSRYWDATWGGNIPDIPSTWEGLGITSDMKEQVFKIALDSPNVEAFRKKLMGDIVIPGAASTLTQMLANKYDVDSGKVIKDFFASKPQLLDFINSFMETGDERLIAKGFEELANKITSDVNTQNLPQYQSTFKDLSARYSNEGIGAVAEMASTLGDMYSKFWIEQTKDNSTLFLDRIVGTIAPEEFDDVYKARMKVQTNDYNIVRGYALMNLGAMIEGLSLDSETSVALMNNMMQFIDIGESYIKQENALYQKYAKKESADYDFKKYYDAKQEMLTQTLDAQQKAFEALHKSFVDYLRNNLDKSWTGHIDRFENLLDGVIKLKQKENQTEIRDWRKRANASNKQERMKISREQEGPRRTRKTEISNAYESAMKQLKQMEGAMEGKAAPATPFSLEDTLKIRLRYDEAKHKADYAGDFLKNFDENADASKVYEPMKFENSRVNTSFYEDGQKQIIENAIKNGTDFVADAAHLQTLFTGGDAVPLGAADVVHAKNIGDTVYIPSQHKLERLKMTDHYELLNPNANLKASEYVVSRSKPFMWGENTVNAGVYRNGVLLGYITQGMQETVVVDGKTFPIIGISKKDPNAYLVLIQDKPYAVTPGKFDGVEFSIYGKQDYHPGDIGTTPTIEPFGTASLESSYSIRQAINLWKEQALSDLHKAQQNGSLFGKMSEDARVAVYEWMDGDLRQAYNAQRYMTQRYGETMVDAALLNYSKRYGFDNLLTMISPYQFWMTRSLANWGKRMISQPAWFSMYARIQRLIEKNKKDFLPTRLNGLIGLPMPNMPNGMGDSFFFDIFNTIFPFQQFYNVTDYFVGNLKTIHQNTLTQIDEMLEAGLITEEQANEAADSKGDLYWKIFEENREADETDTSAGGLLGTFFGPPVWFDMARKHLTGKDKQISYSPMFRMGNMVKVAGQDTPLEEVTDLIGGALQLPENAIRKTFGIESNPDGNFADYGIISNIARMMTEMEISENEAINAIVEGEGNKVYDEALYRYRLAQAQRMQGGALVTELGQVAGGKKETSAGQIAGSALVSLFGGKTFSDGERMHREDQDVYRNIVKHLDKDSDAYKKFWKDHPDYSVYSYAYEDNPEARLHKVLVDNLQNAYYALPTDQMNLAYRQLGTRFQKLFADPETRATNYLENDEIIQWTRALQGNVPNINTTSLNKSMQDTMTLKWYTDSVLGKKERYDKEKAKRFPGIDVVLDGYYNTPANLRTKYQNENPMLKKYWEWNDNMMQANPDLSTLMTNKSASGQVYYGTYDSITDALMSKISSWTLKNLQNYINNGWKMDPAAERILKSVYQGLMTNVPYETWLKSLLK